MAGRIIGYVLVILLSMYLFVMYDGRIWTGLLILELLYPVCSFLLLYHTGQKVKVSFGRFPSMGEPKKQFRGEVVLENRSVFQSVRFCIILEVKYHCSKKGIRQKLHGMLPPSGKQTQAVMLNLDYAGMLECTLESVILYDILGIFRWKTKPGDRRFAGVMPAFELTPLEITRRTREFIADAEDYTASKQGDDPDEIYQIREYRSSDPVHLIHWKLSAKEDAVMVKEHGCPQGCVVLLWIRMPDRETDSAGFHRLLEKAASLSATLFEEKCIHMAAWFLEKSRRVVKWKVDSAEAVYGWIWELLSCEPVHDAALEQACYEEAFRGVQFSSIMILNINGTITVNGEEKEFLQV